MNPHVGLPFRRRQRTALGTGLCVSLLLHALLLAHGRLPPIPPLGFEPSPPTFRVLVHAPVTEIPPPPEPIRRPVEPMVPEVEVALLELDLAIEAPPVELSAPPTPTWPAADTWTSVPGGAPPLLETSTTFVRRIERFYPRSLQVARVEGAVELQLLVDRDGRVARTRIRESSGHPELDEAALGVAGELRFLPALARDRLVEVWVSQRICFSLADRWRPGSGREGRDVCEPNRSNGR